MNRFARFFSVGIAAFAVVLGMSVASAAQKAPNERDVRSILRSLDSRVDDLRYSIRFGLRGNNSASKTAEEAENDVVVLSDKIRAFQSRFNQRNENADDVLDVLSAARTIGDFLASNRVNNTVQSDWTEVRTLLDRLANNYGVSWNSTKTDPDRVSSITSPGLTGTYRLDRSRSERTADIVSGTGVQNEADRQDLESKLEAAEEVAIEVRGNQVTLVSSLAAPVTFTADGRTRTENSGGRTIRVRALIRGQELTVSSLGGETDYTITFSSLDGGRTLKVVRRVTTNYLSQTVFAESFYDKSDSVARLDINTDPSPVTTGNTNTDNNDGQYSTNDPDDRDAPNSPTTTGGRTGDFVVPNGTVITGILENDLTTKISQNNDRFRLTVQTPMEYRGATIEGYISGVNRSGRATGRSQITFNFERITLRDGRTYEFAGFLQSITDQNGKTIKVDTEGSAKGDSQTKETVKRGGIGAGAGALIGAILGGAKGAAIGAIIGGSAGAGTVVLQGKEDLDLKKGSTMTVQSTSPRQ